MSNKVTASIEIDAPAEKVFDFMLDPKSLDEWVTIHKKVNSADSGKPHEGFCMEQTLCLRKVSFKVKWSLTEYERPLRATWEGKGPAGSHARTAYVVSDLGGGRTRLDYENEFKAPGGFLGAAASRALTGGVPEREAEASLAQLKAHLES
jgi:carbon monoxide dehydrogenase subunit G